MPLSRTVSSTTFIVEKRKKKIGCLSGLRPVVNAIRSILPGRRISRNASTSSFYEYLPARDAAKLVAYEDIFSRPPSPVSRSYSPVQSESSIGLNDIDDDNESMLTIDIFDHLDSTNATRDIFSRPPSPSLPCPNYQSDTNDANVSLRTIDIFPTSTLSESLLPTEESESNFSRTSSPSIPSESSWIDGLLEEDSDSIYSNDLFDGPIHFEPLSPQFRLVASSY